MAVTRARIALATSAMAALLAGCSPGSVVDRVPESLGGLPAGAPARPAAPYQYPAVHDMPPARTTRPMTEEELDKAQKELRAVRDRQEGREAAERGAAAGKKPPPAPKTGQNTGAKTNP